MAAAGLHRSLRSSARGLKRAATLAVVLAALLLAALSAASLNRRQRWHAHVANELLSAAAVPVNASSSSGRAHQMLEQPASAAQACAKHLQFPQVALLFLVKGPLHHEALWRRWFEYAAGQLPTEAVASALCASGEDAPQALQACSASTLPPADGLAGQYLFNAYVHPHPNFTGYPPGSLFHGHELPPSQRVATEWGKHSLISAAKALLAASVANPRNAKFLLLSESDLPLYSPHALYLQLLSEERSRINACIAKGWDRAEVRWRDAMHTPFLNKTHWRKSWQWWALSRKHAELVLADRHVEEQFERHCHTVWEGDWENSCYSDEHYIPTLLAVHGLDNETDCQGQYMHVDWARAAEAQGWAAHPWEYGPGELSDRLFNRLRRLHLPECSHATTMLDAAPGAFVHQQQLLTAASTAAPSVRAKGIQPHLLGQDVCHELQKRWRKQPAFQRLGAACPLVARKFLNDTQQAALMTLGPCDSTSLILNDGRCPDESPQQLYWRRRWWHMAPIVLWCSCIASTASLLSWLVWSVPRRLLWRRMLRVPCSRAAGPLYV